MENGLEGLKIGATVIMLAVAISLAFAVVSRGVTLFNSSTDDVSDSVKDMSRLSMAQYEDKEVSASLIHEAVSNLSETYEIRYHTLAMGQAVDFKVYPGTSHGNDDMVADRNTLMDKNSMDYINSDATWFVSYEANDDIPYILFTQIKDED